MHIHAHPQFNLELVHIIKQEPAGDLQGLQVREGREHGLGQTCQLVIVEEAVRTWHAVGRTIG